MNALPCSPYPDPDPVVEAARARHRAMMGAEWEECSPGFFTTHAGPRSPDPLGDSLDALQRLESIVAESIDDVRRNDEARRLCYRLVDLVREAAAVSPGTEAAQ